MEIAFEKFKEINSLPKLQDRHKAWLKDYEGYVYSIAENERHKEHWATAPKKYSDVEWKYEINCIKELPHRLRIEFDTKDKNGSKDKEKIKESINKILEIFKEKKWGYIRSSHYGASDYIWLEFTRNLKDKEKEKFLLWICPEGAEIDLNFASSKKVFPVLYAPHWKHPYKELPIEFVEGIKIDYDSLNINVEQEKIIKKKIKNRSFEYITGIKDAVKIFTLSGQTERFNEIQPLFYDKTGLFWLWDSANKCWVITDEVDILNMIEKNTGKDVISSKNRTEILNALKQKGRLNTPLPIKDSWVQFKDKLYDAVTGESVEASPKYFATNPIPYEINGNADTPTFDKIFKEWVGEEYVETLYEILGYCLIPSYPVHRIFCLIGSGLNGKSKYLAILRKFVGEKNCCSTELDTLINSRFEVTRLHKKLVCQMGETNFNEINKTSMLKKLSGGDLIGFEHKGKTPFEDTNYAKIIISTNNLPATTDKTVGFYRRWMIIDFPNQFSEAKDILQDIPEEEYNNLATRCLLALNRVLDKRQFTREGTIEERIEKYESKSNFLEKFIKEFTVEDLNGYITKSDFLKKFGSWSNENKHRAMSETSIGLKMKQLGYESDIKYFNWMYDGKGGNARIWVGIRWKEDTLNIK